MRAALTLSMVIACSACSPISWSGSIGRSQPELVDAFYVVPMVGLNATEPLLLRMTDLPGSCALFAEAFREAQLLAERGADPSEYTALHARLFPPDFWMVDVHAELTDVDAAFAAQALTHGFAPLPQDQFRVEARQWTTPPSGASYGNIPTWNLGAVYKSTAGSATLSKPERGADVHLEFQATIGNEDTATTVDFDVTASLCAVYEGQLNEG